MTIRSAKDVVLQASAGVKTIAPGDAAKLVGSPSAIFVDVLSFVEGPDGWQIVAKVWHLESTV